MLYSFAPLIGQSATQLVIGTMPSVDSLTARQYYAHPRNQFWPIIFALFANGRAPADYTDKTTTLLNHHIGLWDSLASCCRPGSLDSAITSPVPNDFPALLRKYAGVKKLLFNGQKSYQFFVRAHGLPDRTFFILPSTSPAHASKNFEQKLQQWKAAFNAPCSEIQ